MSRLLTFALFFTILVTLVGGAHYYLWTRLVRDPALPQAATRALTYGLIGLFVAIPGTLFLRRSSIAGLTEPLVWLAMTWLGLVLFLVLALSVADLGRGLWELGRSLRDAPPLDPARRQAAARIVASAAALVGGVLGLWSLHSALGRVRLRRVEITLARLPKTLSG